MKIRVLVTGANGQLGSEIKCLSNETNLFNNINFAFIDIDDLNLINKDDVDKYFFSNYFDFVINCAAYTNVDKAESDKDLAYNVNCKSVEYLCQASLKYKFKIIHISTDYVFNGKSSQPYIEYNPVDPINYYGQTKLLGEDIIINNLDDFLIFRTSWLYSSFGNNFVKTMLNLSNKNDTIKVVFDQIGTPTYAFDLAKTILKIIISMPELNGLYHFSNQGVASWYDFAYHIFKIKNKNINLIPVTSDEFQTVAQRPHYSVLNKSRFHNDTAINIPYWVDSLNDCLLKITNF